MLRLSGHTLLLFAILILGFEYGLAQTKEADSLKLVLKTIKADTNKAILLNKIARNNFLVGQYDSSFKYAILGKDLSLKLHYDRGLGNAFNHLGNICLGRGNFEDALKNYDTSLTYRKKINEVKNIATSYNNKANAYKYLGKLPEALQCHLSALKTREEIKDSNGIAASHMGLGSVYFAMEKMETSLEHYKISLELMSKLHDRNGVANSYLG
ncbi:MAG: tetratricopeptide repeat protein, partial [Bacteroidia bacterium]